MRATCAQDVCVRSTCARSYRISTGSEEGDVCWIVVVHVDDAAEPACVIVSARAFADANVQNPDKREESSRTAFVDRSTGAKSNAQEQQAPGDCMRKMVCSRAVKLAQLLDNFHQPQVPQVLMEACWWQSFARPALLVLLSRQHLRHANARRAA